MGVKRKSGSTHELTVKRNKLGREGNSQKVQFDVHINGGIDWYCPLVRKLGEEYPALVSKSGGWYTWQTSGIEYCLDVEGGEPIRGEICTSKKFRESELGMLIKSSSIAKEEIRKAFSIPDMPTPEVEKEIAAVNKTRRKKKSELEIEQHESLHVDIDE
jgi:hypothetical protein